MIDITSGAYSNLAFGDYLPLSTVCNHSSLSGIVRLECYLKIHPKMRSHSRPPTYLPSPPFPLPPTLNRLPCTMLVARKREQGQRDPSDLTRQGSLSERQQSVLLALTTSRPSLWIRTSSAPFTLSSVFFLFPFSCHWARDGK